MPKDNLKTIKELSVLLGCSTQKLSNWVTRGKVAYKVKYGKKLIVCDENNQPIKIWKEKKIGSLNLTKLKSK